MLKQKIAEINVAGHKHNKRASFSIGFDDLSVFDDVAEMFLKKHNLKATVFLNTYELLKIRNLCGEKFIRYWLDIGRSGTIDYSSHSVRHRMFKRAGQDSCVIGFKNELAKSRDAINSIFNKKCFGFAYPSGEDKMKDILSQYYLFGRNTCTGDSSYLNLDEREFSSLAVTECALEQLFLRNEEDRVLNDLTAAKEEQGWVRIYGHLKEINNLELWDRFDRLLANCCGDNEVYYGNYEEVAGYLYLSRRINILESQTAEDDIIAEFMIIGERGLNITGLIDLHKHKLTIRINFNNTVPGFTVYVDEKPANVIAEIGKPGIFWFEIEYGDHTVKIKKERRCLQKTISPPKILNISDDGSYLLVELDTPSDLTVYYKKDRNKDFKILARDTDKKNFHRIRLPYLAYSALEFVPKSFRFSVACTSISGSSAWDDNNGIGYSCARKVFSAVSGQPICGRKECMLNISGWIIKQAVYIKNKYGSKKITSLFLLILLLVFLALFVKR